MTTATETAVTTQVYRIYVKATPEAIWEAITSPEWAVKYGYRAPVEYDLRPGGKYRAIASEQMLAMGTPETMIDGEVIEVDPPRKLVQTWRPLWDPENVEAFTRVTWDIEEDDFGLTRLTVTHDLEGAPKTAATVAGIGRLAEGGGGWSWILSDLKTLLESGAASSTENC
jgi:uncharacterized protein YndB with AHSA1/START domain